MENELGCKGCYKKEVHKCIILTFVYRRRNVKVTKCPCNICLVKPACMKVCIEYYDFYLSEHTRIKGKFNYE